MKNENILQLIKSLSGTTIDKIDVEKSVSKINREFTYQVRPDTNENIVHEKLIGFKERLLISCKIDKAEYFGKIIAGILGDEWALPSVKFVKNKFTEYCVLDFLLNLSSQLLNSNFIPQIVGNNEKLDANIYDFELPTELSDISEVTDVFLSSESDIFTETSSESDDSSQNSEILEIVGNLITNTQENVHRQLQIDFSCTARNKTFDIIRLGYCTSHLSPRRVTSEIIIGINLLWAFQGFGGIDTLLNDYALPHISIPTLKCSFSKFLHCGEMVLKIRQFCQEKQFDSSLATTSRCVLTEILKIFQKFDCFANKTEMFIHLIPAEEFSILRLELSFYPWMELIKMMNDIVTLLIFFVENNICHSQQNVDLIDHLEKLLEENYYSPLTLEHFNDEDFEMIANQFDYNNLINSAVFNIWISSLRAYFNIMDLSLFMNYDKTVEDFANLANLVNSINFEDLDKEYVKLKNYFPNFLQKNNRALFNILFIAKAFLMHNKAKMPSELLGDSIFQIVVSHFNLERISQTNRNFEVIKYDGYIKDCDHSLQQIINEYFAHYFNSPDEILGEIDSEWVLTNKMLTNPTIILTNGIHQLLATKRLVYSQSLVNILKTQFNLNYHLDNILNDLLLYDSFSVDSLLFELFMIIEDATDSFYIIKNDFLFVILNHLTISNFHGLIDEKKTSVCVVDWLDQITLIYSYDGLVAHFITKEEFDFLAQIRTFALQVMVAKKFIERILIKKIEHLTADGEAFIRFCIIRCRLLSLISNFYRNFVFRIYLDLIPVLREKLEPTNNYEDLFVVWNNFISDLRSVLMWDNNEQKKPIIDLVRMAENLYWISCHPISLDVIMKLEEQLSNLMLTISTGWNGSLYDLGKFIS